MGNKSKPKSEYEKQKAIWYKKLKDSGFEDIEQDEEHLKKWSTSLVTDQNGGPESKFEYYRMCSHFLNDFAFESETEKVIWEYHAEAISVRDIVGLLKTAGIEALGKRAKVDRNSVWTVIRKLEAAMKKMYLSDYSERY